MKFRNYAQQRAELRISLVYRESGWFVAV